MFHALNKNLGYCRNKKGFIGFVKIRSKIRSTFLDRILKNFRGYLSAYIYELFKNPTLLFALYETQMRETKSEEFHFHWGKYLDNILG